MVELCGRAAFWLSWPGLYLYLRNTRRTRTLILCGNEILVVKHWLGRDYWQVPGGGLHKNEGIIEGAAREITEELGIGIEPSKLTQLGSRSVSPSGIPQTLEYVYIVLDEKPQITVQNLEIREFCWMDISAAATHDLSGINDIIARATAGRATSVTI